MSWPVAGTLMIEPTESESLAELNRFCEAMIKIREEIRDIEEGNCSQEDNLLKNAPHTAKSLISKSWDHPYERSKAAYPVEDLFMHKYWPPVGVSKQPIIFISVDFPEPEGPIKATYSPFLMVSERSLTAVTF